jgi:hypothetical protein
VTVANKPGRRGEHEVSRKTIARGMPGVSGVTVVTNARVYYTTRAAAGAPGARHSLRLLMSEGRVSCTTRALCAAIVHSSCPDLIRASIFTKSSFEEDGLPGQARQ